jgi:outer membrane protein assembly factor BamD
MGHGLKSLFLTLLLFIAFGSTAGLVACSSAPVGDPNTPEGMFKIGEELEKDDRYEEAITKFNELKNKHPYSRYATDAELKVADIQYKKEAFIESQTSYQLFKDFHPKHPRSDYVTFQLAMSYYSQLPSTIDRDLTPAHKAIQSFNEVIHSYSTSPYVKESTEKRDECFKMLAEKEMYIANFYFIRDIYDSAQKRYENLLAQYPNRGFDDEALYKAGLSAVENGDKETANRHFNEVLEKHPNSNYASSAKRALEKNGSR